MSVHSRRSPLKADGAPTLMTAIIGEKLRRSVNSDQCCDPHSKFILTCLA